MDAFSNNQPVRFGVFELNLRSGELRKNGSKLKLQEQPFQVLAALVEKPGEVVLRNELKERLWAGDTFVDFDHSLSTAINKIRQVLGDSASHPRFIETIPRRGYRFLAEVTGPARPEKPHDLSGNARQRQLAGRRRKFAFTSATALALVAFFVARCPPTPESPSAPLSAVPLTTYRGSELNPSFSPDGEQVAFSWDGPEGDNFDIYIKVLGEDEPRRLSSDPRDDLGPAWSPPTAGRSHGCGTSQPPRRSLSRSFRPRWWEALSAFGEELTAPDLMFPGPCWLGRLTARAWSS